MKKINQATLIQNTLVLFQPTLEVIECYFYEYPLQQEWIH